VEELENGEMGRVETGNKLRRVETGNKDYHYDLRVI
jgi:hypothetical protein